MIIICKKIEFEVWNTTHNRLATEDEFRKYVRLGFEGKGCVGTAYVLAQGNLEFRIYDGRKKEEIKHGP